MLTRAAVFLALVAASALADPAEVAINAEGQPSPIDGVTLLQTPHTVVEQDISTHTSPNVNLVRDSLGTAKPSAIAAEFIAMTLFVVVGCGSAMSVKNEDGWILQVALSFGLAITALAYAIGHYSGGHINPAVTLGLVIAGNCSIMQGLWNVAAQLVGSVFGALILTQIFPEGTDQTGGLGTNAVAEGFSKFNAFSAELVATFLLVFVVLETATNPESKANRAEAALAIGFAVFLAHSVLIKIDGCSINPARSFGPALVRKLCYKSGGSFEDMWVFVAAPLFGAAGAAFLSRSGDGILAKLS